MTLLLSTGIAQPGTLWAGVLDVMLFPVQVVAFAERR